MKNPASIDPPAVKGAVNVPLPAVGFMVEKTLRKPPVVPLAFTATAGNWLRIEAGTVKVPGPAVVKHTNVHTSVTAAVPVPVVVLDEPMISTRSDASPPVQLRVRPALLVTMDGNPPAIVNGA